MPRPCKRRRICQEPDHLCFGPLGGGESGLPDVGMTLDEYETIRLIDLEKQTQEQCAQQMNVARTTVQSIYASAREKLALALAQGRRLTIGGGDYELCCGRATGCGQACRWRCPLPLPAPLKQEAHGMRIAVTYENGEVFQHFGHTEHFKVYDAEGGRVVATAMLEAEGSGHGALAGLLQQAHVDTLICGGIGGGAKNALDAAGIKLFGGVSGKADAVVEAFLKGELASSPEANCDHHHGQGEEHTCGEHSCGGHDCGNH